MMGIFLFNIGDFLASDFQHGVEILTLFTQMYLWVSMRGYDK